MANVNMETIVRREAGDILQQAEDLVMKINNRLPFLSKITQERFIDKLDKVFAGIPKEPE